MLPSVLQVLMVSSSFMRADFALYTIPAAAVLGLCRQRPTLSTHPLQLSPGVKLEAVSSSVGARAVMLKDHIH